MYQEQLDRVIKSAKDQMQIAEDREKMQAEGARRMRALIDARASTHDKAMGILASEFGKTGRMIEQQPPTEKEYLAAVSRAQAESPPADVEPLGGRVGTPLNDSQLVQLYGVVPQEAIRLAESWGARERLEELVGPLPAA